MEQSDLGAKNKPASASVSLPHQDYADDNDMAKTTNGPKDINTGIEPVTTQAAQSSKTSNTIDQTATSQLIIPAEAETLPSQMPISQAPTAEAENNHQDINLLRTGTENNQAVPVISQSNQERADAVQVVDAGSNITTDIPINAPKDSNTGIEPVTILAAQSSKTSGTIDQTATSQLIIPAEAETLPSKMPISQSPTAEAENNHQDINLLRTGTENNQSVLVLSQSNQERADDVLVVDAGSNITNDISSSKKALDVSLSSPKQIKVPIVSSIKAGNAGSTHHVLGNAMFPSSTGTMKKDNGSLSNSNVIERKEGEKVSSQAAYTLYNHFFHFIPLFVLAGIVFIWFIGIFKLYRRRMSG
jgi:hypothetical protein